MSGTERDSQPHADDLARVAYDALVAYDGMAGEPPSTDAYEPWEALDATDQALMAHTAATAESAVLARLSAALDRQATRAIEAPSRMDTYGPLIDALVEIARAMGIERVGGVRVAEPLTGADDDDGGAGEQGKQET